MLLIHQNIIMVWHLILFKCLHLSTLLQCMFRTCMMIFNLLFYLGIPQSQCNVKCPSSLLICLSLMRVKMKCVVRGDVKTASWPPSSKLGEVGPGQAFTASLCKLISGTHVLLWPSQTILQVGQNERGYCGLWNLGLIYLWWNDK